MRVFSNPPHLSLKGIYPLEQKKKKPVNSSLKRPFSYPSPRNGQSLSVPTDTFPKRGLQSDRNSDQFHREKKKNQLITDPVKTGRQQPATGQLTYEVETMTEILRSEKRTNYPNTALRILEGKG